MSKISDSSSFSKKQLTNLKKKLHGNFTISVSELLHYIDNHSTVPIDDHVFVGDSFIDAKALPMPIIRFFFTTKHLISVGSMSSGI